MHELVASQPNKDFQRFFVPAPGSTNRRKRALEGEKNKKKVGRIGGLYVSHTLTLGQALMLAGLSVEGRFLCHACGPHRAWLNNYHHSLYAGSLLTPSVTNITGGQYMGTALQRHRKRVALAWKRRDNRFARALVGRVGSNPLREWVQCSTPSWKRQPSTGNFVSRRCLCQPRRFDGHTRRGVLRGPSLLLGLVWDRARPLEC